MLVLVLVLMLVLVLQLKGILYASIKQHIFNRPCVEKMRVAKSLTFSKGWIYHGEGLVINKATPSSFQLSATYLRMFYCSHGSEDNEKLKFEETLPHNSCLRL